MNLAVSCGTSHDLNRTKYRAHRDNSKVPDLLKLNLKVKFEFLNRELF